MFYFLIQVVTQHLFLGTLETEITLLSNTAPHTYAATGDYNVVLTASSSTSGCPDSKDSATVHIRTIVANFTTDTLLCGGISYDYDATPSTDVNEFCNRGYTWFFSDTTLRPLTGSSPTESIVFNSTDLQTIGLVVEDINGCVDTLIEEIKVFSGIANFSVSDTTICIPSTLTFGDSTVADTVITNWDWDFGDGNTSTVQHPTNIYSVSSGKYYSSDANHNRHYGLHRNISTQPNRL